MRKLPPSNKSLVSLWFCSALAVGCGAEGAAEGDRSDASTVTDPGSVGDAGNEPSPSDGDSEPDARDDASVAPLTDAGVDEMRDAATAMDASAPGESADYVYGRDCVETFVFDPGTRTDVMGVVLAGSSPFTWGPTVQAGGLPMQRDDDGLYRLRVQLNRSQVEYKFVVNGKEWRQDEANCHDTNDNNGGRNSVLYACQDAPACPVITQDAGVDADAGSELDAGAGGLDAGIGERDAGVALDGGSELDGSVGMDGGLSADYVLGSTCVETIEVDPADYPGIPSFSSVALAGESPLSWEPDGALALQEGDDGLWRATLAVDPTSFAYKLVINGTSYVRNETECAFVDDGFGGKNSVRYTCLDAPLPCSCDLSVRFDPAAAGCADVEAVSYAGEATNWVKQPMTKGDDGTYGITVSAAPGPRQYKIVVTSGGTDAWLADDGDCNPKTGGKDDGNSTQLACVPAP